MIYRTVSARHRGFRALFAAVVAMLLVISTAVVTAAPSYGPARAGATPAPGEPGGNHSKPGDNKKKNKQNQQRRPNGSDTRSGNDDSQSNGNNPRQRPTSQVEAQQTTVDRDTQQTVTTSRAPQQRDALGRFTAGNNGRVGFDEEQFAFDQREEQTGVPIDRRKVAVRMPDPQNPDRMLPNRFYDGLEEISPGKYRGLEHKLNTARLSPQQREFDGLVNAGNPAHGRLDGHPIEIVQSEEIRTTSPQLPSSGPEVDLQTPLELPAREAPPELPATVGPQELAPTPAPVELAPVSVGPQMPVIPPEITMTAIPPNPLAPAIGVPAPGIGTAAPPVPIGTAAAPIGAPATVVPTFVAPPAGPVAIPLGSPDPFASLQAESDALFAEYGSILSRRTALAAAAGFAQRPADVAEWQALGTLSSQVAQRQLEIGVLLHPPAPAAVVAPPAPAPAPAPSTLSQIGSGIVGGLTVLGGIASSLVRPFAVPVG